MQRVFRPMVPPACSTQSLSTFSTKSLLGRNMALPAGQDLACLLGTANPAIVVLKSPAQFTLNLLRLRSGSAQQWEVPSL